MNKNDMAAEIVKASPPLTITGASLLGLSLSDWVLISTLLYTSLQLSWFMYTKYKALKNGSIGD